MEANHLTQEQIERFALPSDTYDAERSRASAHIQSCAQCRAAFEQAIRPFALDFLTEQGGAASECPDSGLLARYAQNTADTTERDLVNMHMETCALCRADVARLTTVCRSMDEADAQAHHGTEAENRKQAEKATASFGRWRAALPMRLPAHRGAAGLNAGWGLPLAGGALAGAAVILLAAPHVRQLPDAEKSRLTARIQQSTRAANALQAELDRQNKLAQSNIQVAEVELEREKQSNRAAGQALADAQARWRHLKAQPLPNSSAGFHFTLESLQSKKAVEQSSGQIVTDSRGNSIYVTPVDVKESRALRAGSLALPLPQLASLARSGGRTMGDSVEEPLALLRPGGTFVSSRRPTFAWKAVSRASAYRLTCIPQDARSGDAVSYAVAANLPASGSDAKLASSPEMAWSIPSTALALRAGATYTWTVQALDAQGSILAASSRSEELFFRTLTTSEESELQRRSRQYADNPLLLGILYARFGILDEADRAFAEYLKAAPNDSLARRLQIQAQAQQRRLR